MTDITLVPVTGASNISAINNNFAKVQEAINNGVLNLTGGNNIMSQDIDLNGNSLLNVSSVGANALLTVTTGDARYYNVSGDTLTGPMNAGTNTIVNLPAAVGPTEPVRKQEFDAAVFESAVALEQRLTNTSDPTLGAALLGRSVVSVASVKDLLAAKKDTTQAVMVAAYYPGVYALVDPTKVVGGGVRYWLPNFPKSMHDGGVFISPTVPWDGTQATVGNFLAGVGETNPGGVGCFVMPVQGEVWVEQYGALGDNASDNAVSFQVATNYLQRKADGGCLRFGLGKFRTSLATINDRSANAALGRVSFRGADENGTTIICTGTSGFLQVGNSQALGAENATSYQRISDMTILKSGGPGTATAITVDLAAWAKFERLNIQGFDYGMYLQDVDHPYFEAVNLRFNNRGLFSRKNPAPGALSTQANNYTFISCSISNNGTYGVYILGGSAINWIGGSIEYNGHVVGATGFGVQLENCGYEGGVGANFQGAYIESNNGIADIVLKNQYAGDGPMLGVLHKISCDFHRTAVGSNTNNILALFGPTSTVGFQSLDVRGSSFKSFGTYVPNAATRNIAFGDTPAGPTNFFDHGTYYSSAVERPTFSQSLNRYYATLSKAANQSIPNATWTKYLLDTVSNNFMYVPTLTTNDVTIPETATYTISATVSFAANTTGVRGVRLKVGSTVIASADMSAAVDNIVTVARTRRLNVSGVVSVEVYQSSTAALDALAPASGESFITITKEVG